MPTVQGGIQILSTTSPWKLGQSHHWLCKNAASPGRDKSWARKVHISARAFLLCDGVPRPSCACQPLVYPGMTSTRACFFFFEEIWEFLCPRLLGTGTRWAHLDVSIMRSSFVFVGCMAPTFSCACNQHSELLLDSTKDVHDRTSHSCHAGQCGQQFWAWQLLHHRKTFSLRYQHSLCNPPCACKFRACRVF